MRSVCTVSKTFRLLVMAMIAALALGMAACGDDDDDDGGGGGGAGAGEEPAAESIKAGVVTDIGGLNDRSFNALANKGIKQAESMLGVENHVLTSKSHSDYVTIMATLAQ